MTDVALTNDVAKQLNATIVRVACAYAQISGNFHKAWYGHWLTYEHTHHPECCHPLTHEPVPQP